MKLNQETIETIDNVITAFNKPPLKITNVKFADLLKEITADIFDKDIAWVENNKDNAIATIGDEVINKSFVRGFLIHIGTNQIRGLNGIFPLKKIYELHQEEKDIEEPLYQLFLKMFTEHSFEGQKINTTLDYHTPIFLKTVDGIEEHYNLNVLFENYLKTMSLLFAKYGDILNNNPANFWVNAATKKIAEHTEKNAISVVTDSRFVNEVSCLANSNFNFYLLIPLENGELILKNQENILEMYEKVNSFKDIDRFLADVSKNGLCPIAEELSTLLTVHEYLKNKGIMAKAIVTEYIEKKLNIKLNPIFNNRGDLYELYIKAMITLINNEDKNISLMAISKGGKDTFLQLLMQANSKKTISKEINNFIPIITQYLKENPKATIANIPESVMPKNSMDFILHSTLKTALDSALNLPNEKNDVKKDIASIGKRKR